MHDKNSLAQLMAANLPEGAKHILNTLTEHGFEAYLVGGCVRDILLGTQPNDWDITTNALPSEVKGCFPELPILDTGIKHGTVTILVDGGSYEVTTYRVDGNYSDDRHPDAVTFTSSLEEDLARRDFTINAMAMDISGNLIDPFHGGEDIRKGIIKCVGDPDMRFQEDALRILRALRFASRLGFRVDKNTAAAIMRNKALLANISVERIQKEFVGILCGSLALETMSKFRDVIAEFIPEIRACFDFKQNNPSHCYDVYEHILNSVDSISADPVLKLAMFFHDIGKPLCYTEDDAHIGHFHGHASISRDITKARMKALHFDNETIEAVTQLVKWHDVVFVPASNFVLRMLNKMGEEQFKRLLAVRQADIMAQSRQNYQPRMDKVSNVKLVLKRVLAEQKAFKVKDLAVNGHDLIAAGVKPGPEMGALLNRMLEAVMEGSLANEKDALLDFAKKQA